MSWLHRLRQWLRRLRARRAAAPEADAGLWGEEQAARFLRQRGFHILARRVRPNRRDELDLVARQGDTLVFVEVKTRRSERFGRPAAAIGRAKRHALCRAAAAYLRRLNYPGRYYRFDIVEVVGCPGTEARIHHIENGFPFESHYRFPPRRRR